MKIYESKADQEKFISWGGEELYNRFLKQKQRLSGQETDMYYWMKLSPEELDARLSELENTPTRSQKSATASDGSRLVYRDNNWTVRQIDTYEAAVKYGKNTQWCITGCDRWEKQGYPGRETFDNYFDDGIRFLFFESKRPINGMHKWACAVHKYRYEIYNETDDPVDEVPNLPNIENLNIVQDTGFARYFDKSGAMYIALSDNILLYDDELIKRYFRKDWQAEDSNDYNASDIKQYLESGQFAKDAILGINYKDIFLLSVEEAEQLPKGVLEYDGWWWLRSPGGSRSSAAYVYCDGSVDYFGLGVNHDYVCVRPAFKISNTESQNLKYIGNIEYVEFTPEKVIKR